MTSPSRRGHGNGYTPTHPHIAPSLGHWRGKCGRCGATIGSGQSKKAPIFGLVCREGCKK